MSRFSSLPNVRTIATIALNSLAVFSAVTLGACRDAALVGPATSEATASDVRTNSTITEPASGTWSRIVEGQTGPGALYALYVPRVWNGDAVYIAHGFRDVSTPVDLRDDSHLYEIRDKLGEQGYAIAYSSYSENGFAVKDGGQRTHQLRGLLNAQLPHPSARNFLLGHSLGGGIALDLAERYSSQYNGALLVCGMVGGSTLETQYLGHVRALFDAFYPGALPGTVLGVPDGTVVSIPQIIAAVQSNPVGLFAIASTAQTPLPYVPVGNVTDPASPAFQTLVGSLYAATSFHARGINNIVDLVHGKSPFDNSTTTYELGTPVLPAALIGPAVAYANATVARYTGDRSALNYLANDFTPTGNLNIPVLTVHNTWDPAVPLFHEAALYKAAQAAGKTQNLLQRQVPSYGHCEIPGQDVVSAFGDLATWVATGVKP